MLGKTELNNITNYILTTSKTIFSNKLKTLILYGSYARGDFEEESDVDIMLVVDMKKEELTTYRKNISSLSSKLSLDYDVTVSIHLQDLETLNHYKNALPFFVNILREGVIVNA